jgi:hypothetical protein
MLKHAIYGSIPRFAGLTTNGFTNTKIINNVTIPVGCVPRMHRLIGVIACLPVGRGITPYKVVKELNAFVFIVIWPVICAH